MIIPSLNIPSMWMGVVGFPNSHQFEYQAGQPESFCLICWKQFESLLIYNSEEFFPDGQWEF